MTRSSIRLSTNILRTQLAVLFAVLLVAFGLSLWLANEMLVRQFEQRALAIAQTVAVDPEIADAAAHHDPDGLIRDRAEDVRRASGALFVVVTDAHGVRFSHPTPTRIGEHVSTDPSGALAGNTVVNMERGTLGLSARAKVPLRDANDSIIGEVSVGIDAEEISGSLWRLVPSIALYTGIALAVGVVVSLFLARRLKRQTFGLELNEIASLLQEREAMLHGIAEGMVGLGPHDEVVLLNDEARRLLALDDAPHGRSIDQLVPQGRIRDILTGTIDGTDLVVLTDDHVLVMNRMPVDLRGRDLGHVVTISDRTEQERVLRELDSVRGLTDALRAQQHEFANRVHALSGMLELDRVDDAIAYIHGLFVTTTDLSAHLQRGIASPQLVGLLVAKSVVASERGVTLTLTDESALTEDDGDPRALLTVLGNLIDNAIDAATTGAAPRTVEVDIRCDVDDVHLRISDSGAGIPADTDPQRVFEDGYSTKPDNGTRRRGLGLALVHRVVMQQQGTITVTNGPGAVFTVTMPRQGTTHPLADAEAVSL